MRLLCALSLSGLLCSYGASVANLRYTPYSVSSNIQGEDPSGVFLKEKYDSGYVNIKETFGTPGEMFFWHFPARKSAETAPLIIWLTGGPGCSSELAALTENGPFNVQPDGSLKLNEKSWSEVANIVYVDQPLGTGFSKAHYHYVVSEDKIAADMSIFLRGFLDAHPEYKDRPFFITGESYAGHYIPSIASFLVKNPIEGVNLQGIALGNAWVDPASQYAAYPDFALEAKMIDDKQYPSIKKGFTACAGAPNTDVSSQQIAACNMLMQGLLGGRNPYDVRLKCDKRPLCYDMTPVTTLLNREDAQAALGVKQKWEACNMLVHLFLTSDFGKSMSSRVVDVLEAGKQVLVYSGDKDFICNYKGGQNWLANLQWKRVEEFSKVEEADWVVQDNKLGTVRRLDNLAFLKVFDAGHMVPMDQPTAGLELLREFIVKELLKSAEMVQ